MGLRGPKPDPAAIKEAKGNPGRRPIGADPVVAGDDQVSDAQERTASVSVAAPVWLKGEGLDIWDRLAPRLVSMKLLSQVDAEAFGRYCRNYARWIAMQDVLDREGEVYESESTHGKLKRAHPSFMIADRLERQLQAVEDRFGLNPAERQRLYAARASQPIAIPGELPLAHPPSPRPQAASPGARSGAGSPVGFLN